MENSSFTAQIENDIGQEKGLQSIIESINFINGNRTQKEFPYWTAILEWNGIRSTPL